MIKYFKNIRFGFIASRLNSLARLQGGLFLLAFAVCISSCKKFVDINPPVSEVVSETVFTDDRSATSAIVGIYSKMMSVEAFAGLDMGFYPALSADELKLLTTTPEQSQFENNTLLSTNSGLLSSFWEPGYRYIWYANSAIEGLSRSTGVSEAVKMQLLGEAKFIRAFCHFQLTNLFGAIPYITSSDYRLNEVASKISQAEVYNKIIEDLLEAQTNLPDNYITSGRVRPNRGAATALLARVYLYTGDWSKAEIEASASIADSKYQLEADLNKVFIAGSKEAIWQLMPVNPGLNTWEEKYITSGQGALTLTNGLLNSFEANDNRKNSWIKSWTNGTGTVTTYYPYKYKAVSGQPLTEYNMVFRLAEQFLIRAEARTNLNKLTGAGSAASDLNVVRNRAGLNNTSALTQADFLDAILRERRVELFTEWGHRWFDLKRMNKATPVLGPVKSGWQPTDVLYPIPQTELDKNRNLLPQNAGY
jgi:hypothetical protein